ncbi:SGNH/GDSL hydrolase family protein [Halarchaeum sp. P4]|uniref:SGNH/GDSL hydrolase family protein n=1 Tax=Halarchaeum sp. P4 TaxID=3421639 RepID=UPI003EB81B48
MESTSLDGVALHNVAETVPAEWAEGGEQLCRVPESVGEKLNEDARERVRHPTNGEIRFVPADDETEVEVTLSAAAETHVRVFWGSFQRPFRPWDPIEVGPEPRTLTFSVPERIARLDAAAETGRFDPRVCRILFERLPAAAIHDVSGDCRPPTADELPEARYLAYGTSITEGAAATAPHLNFVSHVARERGYDALNLGCSGSAYCEAAMAEHIAGREDWDVATLELSVNMANAEFSVGEFRERVETFVDTVAGAHPETPVVCVTLFPYFADVVANEDAGRAADFREAVRNVVVESAHENVSLIEGAELLDTPGLTTDVLHPGDAGMGTIGRALAERLDAVVD